MNRASAAQPRIGPSTVGTVALAILGCRAPPPPNAAPPAEPLSASAAETWLAHLEQWRGTRLDAAFDANPRPVSVRAAYAGSKPVAVAFWATYCPPCLEEIPMFDRLFAEGHAVLGVSLDAGNLPDVQRVLEVHRPRYPQLVLDTPSMKAAGKALARGLPFTLATDRTGRPRHALWGRAERAAVLGALRSAATP